MARQSIFDMKVSKIYPLLLQKVERKGRSKEELDTAIKWLTGYDMDQVDQEMTYGDFFKQAAGKGAAMNNGKRYEYDAVLYELDDNGGAYVIFPWDIREEFGKGRVEVHALFDGIPYDGSIVNMGVKNPDGSVCYIIGVLKTIRNKLNKHDGDTIHVVIEAEE